MHVGIDCSKEKEMRRAKRRGELFRASAWWGPLFIFPFWAEGDRRVSHATRRHPAGHPRKGAIAAGKEGLAIGINYCEWRGLCLLFSPLFLKAATEGKNSTPTTGCPLHFWKGFAFQVTNLTSLLSPTLKALLPSSGMLWGFVVMWGPWSVYLFHNFKMWIILIRERQIMQSMQLLVPSLILVTGYLRIYLHWRVYLVYFVALQRTGATLGNIWGWGGYDLSLISVCFCIHMSICFHTLQFILMTVEYVHNTELSLPALALMYKIITSTVFTPKPKD